LIEVFTLFGAPHILQSDNGREFTALLKLMWPELVIVHGFVTWEQMIIVRPPIKITPFVLISQ
jgi:hypothetical protein